MDHRRPDPRLSGRRPDGRLGSDDRHATTNRALARLWCGCRSPGGHRRVHNARRHDAAVHAQRVGLGSDARLADHNRLADRLRQVAGRHPRNPDPVQGTAIAESADLSRHGGLLRLLARTILLRSYFFYGMVGLGFLFGVMLGHPDWIGRHAGGDVAVEQLCRACRPPPPDLCWATTS